MFSSSSMMLLPLFTGVRELNIEACTAHTAVRHADTLRPG